MLELLHEAAPASAWHWGDYTLDPARRRLTCRGEVVVIEDRLFDLLALLLQRRERPLDRRELTEAIWGKRPVSDATLRQLVHAARRAVGDDGDHQHTISTLYGRGLQWVAPVELVFEVVDTTVDPANAPAVEPAAAPVVIQLVEPSTPPLEIVPAAEPLPTLVGVAPPARRAPHRRTLWLLGTLVVLAAVGLMTWRFGWLSRTTPPATAGVTTLAVLPFDMLDAPGQQYLSDGLTEELVDRLAKMPRLRVKARSSAFELEGKQVSAQQAAKLLGVEHVLEGSMQRAGDKWRVRVALVDAGDGYERWADVFDVGDADLLGMEDQVARHVLVALYPRLQPTDVAGGAATTGIDQSAHQDYLVGLEYLRQRNPADFTQAVVHFRRAVAIAPDYAEAWSALATTYAIWTDYENDILPDTYYPDAVAAATQAVKANPDSARAHAVLGYLHMQHWEWQPARDEFQLAIKLDPDDAMAHHWYAIYMAYTGDLNGALQQSREAIALDPLSPVLGTSLGRYLLYTGHAGEAVTQLRKVVTANPRFRNAHIFLAEAYMALGQRAESLQQTRAVIALVPTPTPPNMLSQLGGALWETGDHAGAKAQFAQLEALSQKQHVSGVSLAFLASEVGADDKVFAPLLRAVDEHDHLMQPVIGDPTASWRSDPHFAQVLARMNLPLH